MPRGRGRPRRQQEHVNHHNGWEQDLDGDHDMFIEERPRIIAHFDADCFEGQVWAKEYNREQDLLLKECVVVNQSNRVVAVNHLAKSWGISREHTPFRNDVERVCPSALFLEIRNRFDKPDRKPVRRAGHEIRQVVKEWLDNLNINFRSDSEDEFFLDFTEYVWNKFDEVPVPSWAEINNLPEKTFIEGRKRRIQRKELQYRVTQVLPRQIMEEHHKHEAALFHGALLANNLINYILEKTGYRLSAGISFNMLLAKMACSHNKPGAITVLPLRGFDRLSKQISYTKIPGLGHEKGRKLARFFPKVKNIADLANSSVQKLRLFFSTADVNDFLEASTGLCNKEVVPRPLSPVINCGKGIYGKKRRVEYFGKIFEHLWQLSQEMKERLDEEREWNHRGTHTFKLVIKGQQYFRGPNQSFINATFSASDTSQIVNAAKSTMERVEHNLRANKLFNKITYICLSAVFQN